MEEHTNSDYTGLVYYKALEGNILCSIRLGKLLTGKGGTLTPPIKKLLEASIEEEMTHYLSNDLTEPNRRNGKSSKTLRTSSGSFDLLTPKDRLGSFEPQIVKKRQKILHPVAY